MSRRHLFFCPVLQMLIVAFLRETSCIYKDLFNCTPVLRYPTKDTLGPDKSLDLDTIIMQTTKFNQIMPITITNTYMHIFSMIYICNYICIQKCTYSKATSPTPKKRSEGKGDSRKHDMHCCLQWQHMMPNSAHRAL